jgi:hypothetical protein
VPRRVRLVALAVRKHERLIEARGAHQTHRVAVIVFRFSAKACDYVCGEGDL